MRFDYYSASIEDDSKAVIETLRKLGDELQPCHNLAKAYHFDKGYAVMRQDSGLVCKVFHKPGAKPYAFASSDATDDFCDLVRNQWTDKHLRRKLTGIARRMAKDRRMRLSVICDR